MVSTGQAIPLILFQEREGFKASPEGLEFLASIPGKVAVVAVAGKYRTGKSYLLNRVVLGNEGRGFTVGPTINPCTKGLWIWNQPIDFTTSDGEQVTLLVIDTEGIGAFDEDQNHDTRIFMMAVLLCSYFVYNSVGSIDENALNNLNLVVNLTKNLQVRSSDTSLDVDEVADYFPSFLWVLRDFALQLVDPAGNPISSREYLESALQLQKGLSDSIEAKNRVRKLLKHFFRDRDCFAVVRPTEREHLLQNLNQAPDSELRPEFVRQISQLRKLIYRKVKVKQFKGQAVTGEMLGTMILSYLEAINKGGVPTIEGAWTSIVSAEREKNIEATTKEFEEALRQEVPKGPINPKQLKVLNKDLRKQALSKLRARAVGDFTPELEEALLTKLEERFSLIAQQNERKLQQQSNEFCKALEIEMQDKLKQGEYTDFNEFKKDFEARCKELKESGSDPVHIEAKLKELAAVMLAEGAEYINRSALLEHKNENRRLQQQLEFVQQTLTAKKEDFQSDKEAFNKRINELQAENYQLKADKAALELRLEELKAEKLRLEEKLESAFSVRTADTSEYREKYEELLESHNKELKQLNKQITELQKEAALAAQQAHWKENEGENLKKQVKNLESSYKEIKTQLKAAKEEADTKERQLSELKQTAVAPNEWQIEKTYLQSHVDSLQAQLNNSRTVQEQLIAALQSKPAEQSPDSKESQQKALAYERLETKYSKQKNKLGSLAEFKAMVESASALQCRACGKVIPCKNFMAHVTSCVNEMSRINTEGGYYHIVVPQSVVKESPDMKPYTEYLMTVTFRQKTWNVTRRFKLFATLHNSLVKHFPDVQLPESDLFISQSPSLGRKPVELEERRRAVQNYMMELASIPVVKNSDIFRKFLGVEQQFGEPSRRDNLRSYLDFA